MIGPFDFMMLRSERASQLEKAIDERLRHAAQYTSGPVEINVAEYPSEVVDRVAEEYMKVGWLVSRESARLLLEAPR